MADLEIERRFSAAPQEVFAAVSRPENLARWWGPEGMSLKDCVLDFTRTGPWTSTMISADGATYTVSGEVLTVDPPTCIEMTWAWHDENGERGHESRVRFEVEGDSDGGSVFRLIQTGLADEDSATTHDSGWTSSLRKLEALVEKQGKIAS